MKKSLVLVFFAGFLSCLSAQQRSDTTTINISESVRIMQNGEVLYGAETEDDISYPVHIINAPFEICIFRVSDLPVFIKLSSDRDINTIRFPINQTDLFEPGGGYAQESSNYDLLVTSFEFYGFHYIDSSRVVQGEKYGTLLINGIRPRYMDTLASGRIYLIIHIDYNENFLIEKNEIMCLELLVDLPEA